MKDGDKIKKINEILESIIKNKDIDINYHLSNIEDEDISHTIELLQKYHEKNSHILIESSRQAMMGSMLSMIAHQWKQPITNIKLLATSLELKVEDKDFKKDIPLENIVIEQAENIKSIVDELSLTMTDFIDFFKPTKEKNTIEIQDIIKSSIKLTSASFEAKGIDININATDNIIINTYDRELKQVIINILNNAKDAMISKHIKNPIINIDITKNENIAYIKIQDNAGGIRENVLPKIFDLYFTTKSSSGGGLGLYMCKVIIKKHLHGNIYAKNIDNGAVFTIEFPII